jgi:hypothetical protein
VFGVTVAVKGTEEVSRKFTPFAGTVDNFVVVLIPTPRPTLSGAELEVR